MQNAADAIFRSQQKFASRRKVLLRVIGSILIVVSIIVGTGTLIERYRNRTVAAGERKLTNLALLIAEQVDHAFQQIEIIQGGLTERMYLSSQDEYDRKMSGYDVHLALKNTINNQTSMNALIVINVQGKVINWSRNWPIPDIDVSDRDYFEALKTNQAATSFLSKPLQSRGSGLWTIGLGRKVLGPNGELFGLVLGAMDVRDLERLFEGFALGQKGSISLIRFDGELLAHYPNYDTPLSADTAAELRANGLLSMDRKIVRLTESSDGKEHLVAIRALAHYPAIIAVRTNVWVDFSNWKIRSGIVGGVGLLATFLVVCIVFWIRGNSRTQKGLTNLAR